MNLLASAVKSATYEELSDLAKWVVDSGGLDQDYKGFGDPLMKPNEVADAILDWASTQLKAEVN